MIHCVFEISKQACDSTPMGLWWTVHKLLGNLPKRQCLVRLVRDNGGCQWLVENSIMLAIGVPSMRWSLVNIAKGLHTIFAPSRCVRWRRSHMYLSWLRRSPSNMGRTSTLKKKCKGPRSLRENLAPREEMIDLIKELELPIKMSIDEYRWIRKHQLWIDGSPI